MASAEFSLIDRYFLRTGAERDDVLLGVGDDAALLRVPSGHELVVAVGTCSPDSRLDAGAKPEFIAHQCFATTLNRLAASAAQPFWLTLTLAMPRPDESWLAVFASRLQTLTKRYGTRLVGGDTTRGPLRITLHAHGLVPSGMVATPNLAQPGDLVYVTGDLGSAGLALLARQGKLVLPAPAQAKLETRASRPEPRVRQGSALRGLASAAVSISEGLAGGLSDLLGASRVGASLLVDRLPVSPEVADNLAIAGGWALPLAAPGDHELCFTIPPDRQGELEARFTTFDVGCTWVGTVERTQGLRCLLTDGTHFAPG